MLAHELTHVILKADYPGHDGWPLWFQEGLAMRESRTEGLREYVTLSAAALFDRLLPLERLSVSFPAAEAEARLAYAESASFLAFLDAQAGRERFVILMRELRGRGFEDAFRIAYGAGTGAAEGQWLRWVNRRFAWVPALTSETAFWLLMTLLFLLAIAVRRRRSRLMRERWEKEEEEDGRLD
ncbi:MAG TPA: peptidase MA family metallohydrolase [Candidatus Methanoperedens sp.]|nr:peptidase MA family metallohydrolase [Candidatus Methanoperedens sp.]